MMAVMAPKKVLVIYLIVNISDSKFQLWSLSNSWYMDYFLSYNFCNKGGRGTTFKYPLMLERSTWSFRHPEHQNPSIIEAMANWSRIEKMKHTDREQTTDTDKPIKESPLIAEGMVGWGGQYIFLSNKHWNHQMRRIIEIYPF